MTTPFLLNNFLVVDHVKEALKEDVVYGDISTDFLCDEDKEFTVYLKTRQDGIFCGEIPFRTVFEILGGVELEFYVNDGGKIKKGDRIAKIKGSARSILTGERLALNYAQRMSAIATKANKFSEKVKDYPVRIVDTRKNTPNFRMFEKYAIKCGGASLHRFNLSDCVMLKDNHIALCDGSIELAVQKVRKNLSHAHKIEVECDTVKQVHDCVKAGVDIIMLDNMNTDDMKKCIKFIRESNPNAVIEASGGINLDNIEDVAKTGVDVISTSSLVVAGTMDLGFDWEQDN
ncbi:MAG: carboxylating nicotinate-nucleotide diphosphorylase [Cyanobacteria bacterium SIG30]|nr:carboxylating nicotinate-nucleotide diphosphorylase [Cyanobacteria bacterium SIG30]